MNSTHDTPASEKYLPIRVVLAFLLKVRLILGLLVASSFAVTFTLVTGVGSPHRRKDEWSSNARGAFPTKGANMGTVFLILGWALFGLIVWAIVRFLASNRCAG
jgi:hypothetical protein